MGPPALRAALRQYRERLERETPGRIAEMLLFGSWARGEAHEDSDVDVLVVIDALTTVERLRAIELGAIVGLEHELVLEAVVLSSEEWRALERSERLFAKEVRREGVELA